MITEEKIKNYIEKEKLYPRALLIDDTWGKGKSSIIKNILSGKIEGFEIQKAKSYLILNANDIDEKTSFRQLLISESKKINTNIFFDQDNEILSSQLVKTLAENKKTLKNILTKVTDVVDGYIENKTGMEGFITNSFEIFGLGGESVLKKMNYDNYILVIDEVDRMNNPSNLKNIYAKIIEIQENTKIRVIVVMNSLKVDNDYHNEWKDKIYSASIKVENTKYFNMIKPDIWNKVEEELRKITPNYKNIRILEKYLNLENFINETIISLQNKKLNRHQQKKIENKKIDLIRKMYVYYNEIDYKFFLGKKFNKNNYKEEIEEIENILNMETSFLVNTLKKILEEYNDDYSKLQDNIEYLYKEFFHKDQTIQKSKKKEAIPFIINTLINKNINKMFINYHEENKFFGDNIIMHYHEILINHFKMNKKEEMQFISQIMEKMKLNKEKYKSLSTLEKTKEFHTQKMNYYHMSKQIFLNKNQKHKILKIIKKDINKIFKDIINNYNDELPTTVKHFHFKYNFNIIKDIYDTLDDKYYLLDKLRELKNFSKDNFENKKNIHYKNLDIKHKITKDELNKV